MSYLDDFWDQRKKIREEKAQLTPEQKKVVEEKALVEQRERLINYKKFFGEAHGRQVMLDLMNKYLLSPGNPACPHCAQKEMVVGLLGRANVNVEQLDKILKGEF